MQRTQEFDRRNAAYREAFEEWTRQVHHWQSVAADSSPDEPAFRDAVRRMERAEAAYLRSRDRLAEYLLNAGAKSDTRSQAYRLWEAAGRPIGNPDEYWFRAERLQDADRPDPASRVAVVD